MASTFQKATQVVLDMFDEIIIRHHSALDSVGAKIDVLMAFRDPEGEVPALMLRGHRALGIASLHPLHLRALGLGDALVRLDGDEWADMSEVRKRALVDHELTHFEVKRDKTGDYIYDDLNRPVLKMRLHDREIGWFDDIALRHGMASEEVRQFASLLSDEAGQSYLRFVDSEVAEAAALAGRSYKRLERKAGKLE